ncbi:unnamed protein product [Hymenolepis diminuta]|nr:unnamed protein product [Hymenolepis diminuta]
MEMFNDVMNILKPLRLRRATSDYKIMKHISSGGHGSVYVGRHKETGKMVAIKELELPFGTKNLPIRISAYRDVQCLNTLNHENIVKIHDLECKFDVRGGEYMYLFRFAMDLCDFDLYKVVVSKAQLTDYLKQDIARQLLNGLCYLHHQNIVHRDLKPGNILIKLPNQLKI